MPGTSYTVLCPVLSIRHRGFDVRRCGQEDGLGGHLHQDRRQVTWAGRRISYLANTPHKIRPAEGLILLNASSPTLDLTTGGCLEGKVTAVLSQARQGDSHKRELTGSGVILPNRRRPERR
jgi:hypothetical protein